MQAFTKKAQIKDEEEGGQIRVYEIHHHKFFRELTPTYPVISLNEYADVIAERIPEDELEAEDRHFIKVQHFDKEQSRTHGMPFKFLLHPVSLDVSAPHEILANMSTGGTILRNEEETRKADRYQRKGLREDQVCGAAQI